MFFSNKFWYIISVVFYELILFRASLYSNYNIIIYSKSQKLIDTLSGKILKLYNSKFNVENISDLQDCKNFLLV